MARKKKKKSNEKKPEIAKRFQRDLNELEKAKLEAFRNFTRSAENPLKFSAIIVPKYPPYNIGAYFIEIFVPIEYPFKPPKIVFRTKIYHPNIDEMGKISFPMIWSENWKPTTTLVQVIQALLALIHDPVLENKIRIDVAKEFISDKPKFMLTAENHARKYALEIPSI